jgi:hypothetical protein
MHSQTRKFVLAFTILAVISWSQRINPDQNGKSREDDMRSGKAIVLVIARTHARENASIVSAFLSSLRAQSFRSFHVWLVNGERPGVAVFSDIIDELEDNRVLSMTFGDDSEPLRDSSYGYYTSDMAVRELLRRNDIGTSSYEYLLVTNADNLYNHVFLETVVDVFSSRRSKPCIVATDWVSRYHARPVPGVLGNKNTVRKVEFRRFRIDLGTAVVDIGSLRRVFAGRTEYFVKNSTTADWTYFENILRDSGSCGVAIGQVLFVHQ